jgi:hypothetical protein
VYCSSWCYSEHKYLSAAPEREISFISQKRQTVILISVYPVLYKRSSRTKLGESPISLLNFSFFCFKIEVTAQPMSHAPLRLWRNKTADPIGARAHTHAVGTFHYNSQSRHNSTRNKPTTLTYDYFREVHLTALQELCWGRELLCSTLNIHQSQSTSRDNKIKWLATGWPTGARFPTEMVLFLATFHQVSLSSAVKRPWVKLTTHTILVSLVGMMLKCANIFIPFTVTKLGAETAQSVYWRAALWTARVLFPVGERYFVSTPHRF